MTPRPERLRELVARFSRARVAVVGDLLADVYVYGRPYRLSREAPVIVVRHEREEVIPGGAANTAKNLAALGATTHPVGLLGDDPAGADVRRLLAAAGGDVRGCVTAPGSTTVTKTRIMAGGVNVRKQQVIRIDRETPRTLDAATRGALRAAVEGLRGQVDGVIVSDYGYDTCTPEVVAAVRGLAPALPVLVDSRHRLREFAGATLATPNEEEFESAAGGPPPDDRALVAAGERLRQELGMKALCVTRGNKGMLLFEPGAAPLAIPVSGGTDVIDVTGAGDTVAAVTMLGLVAGGTFAEAAHLANAAAGVVVMKLGAATLAPDELTAAIGRGGARG